MNDIQSRLEQCFLTVFPALPRERVRLVSPRTIPGWDSLKAVTLVSVIEEEFGVQLPLENIGSDDVEQFFGWEALERYLSTAGGPGEARRRLESSPTLDEQA